MELNDFVDAIAQKLRDLWPDRNVYVDEIPQGTDGNFYVGVIESDQGKRLGLRRVRTYQFEVLYFLRTNENLEYYAWAETMFDQFEDLQVGAHFCHLTNQTAQKSIERVYQFLFNANLNFVYQEVSGNEMEVLDQKGDLKK